MFSINQINNNETNITVIRGDTFREQIRIINDERLRYIPVVGDRISFNVFKKYTDAEPIFTKRIPYDTCVLELKAQETANMKLGNYVYTIKLERMNSDTDTFVHGTFVVKGGAI